MNRSRLALWLTSFFAAFAPCVHVLAETGPALIWITNSTVKVEQILGDYDFEDYAHSNYLPTASQTVTRFNILGSDTSYSFEDNGKIIFLFGDTISQDVTNVNYRAADPLAWSTNTDGTTPLLLNFFTNNPIPPSGFVPLFVQPAGIKMGPYDVPDAGISLSDGIFFVCTTGADTSLTNAQVGDLSELVTFNESLAFSTNTVVTNIFVTNRVVSMLNSNLDPRSPLQGHFLIVSMHEFGTNVVMFGAGEYRQGDVFLCMIPTANFVSGVGTLYFAGLANGQPIWSDAESNCVPVVQDNPTNGPPWPNDNGTVGNVSVTHPQGLSLWLMTYDGGRGENSLTNRTTGIYFAYAAQPWGPWSTPQLIFNNFRDHGAGVFIHDPNLATNDGLDGPVIGTNSPTETPGGVYAPNMIERFTSASNSTLYIYYTMSTWNPYTVVKMSSAFNIVPVIDPTTVLRTKDEVTFSWAAPTNESYQVDYTSHLLAAWTTITNVITSTNGTFNFTDDGTNTGGLGNTKYYRVRNAN